ncbi:hypothetical protein BB559_000175 [Furculomyces boomerangus]|uniref:Succinylglutamate desuccinylase/Aspartoacylase catalytic domain-containing protein n=1 Tax=Furculomyces boomerangus TaxID=61424 RepID=A0A2T9Z612_9FUNG|nr:hypothetical protein BB559_000175 [Furculomyces boomerangus]
MKINFIASVLFAAFARSAMVYTGDTIDGYQVASQIDVDALPPCSNTRVWLQMPRSSIGQSWHVPVMIAKGEEGGKRLLMNSGIHGDGLNGIRVVQRVINDIDASKLKGVVIGIPGANVNGMLYGKHSFVSMAGSGFLTNLNQYFPGDVEELDDVYQYVGILWDRLISSNNVTHAVDFQTAAIGNTGSVYVEADKAVDYVNTMVSLSGADIATYKTSDPDNGSLDEVLNSKNVSSIVYQLANPRLFELDVIQRGYEYIFRLINDLGIYQNTVGDTDAYKARKGATFQASAVQNHYANFGGFVETEVELNQDVKEGQVLATMYDPHGDVIDTFKAKSNGRILAMNSDPLRDPGALVVAVAASS